MEKLSFKTAEFEGPLDLMLHLIQKHKLDICDICISELLDQYMAYINTIEGGGMELASEFLEMASRLVYIKTVMLLPKHEEEVVRLKAELQGQLLEYQVCREVAETLGERSCLLSSFVRPQMKLKSEGGYALTHLPAELWEAYQDAIGKGKRRLPPPAHVFSGIVARRVVSVGSRIIFVLKKLYRGGYASYDSLFESSGDRSELVATFLAVLELVKAKRVTLDDEGVHFDRTNQPKHRPEEAVT